MELPADFDARHFWSDEEYAARYYTEPWPSDELVARVEADLGYRLPAFYVALMRTRNGGVPVNTCFPTTEATGWADDHIAISGIAGHWLPQVVFAVRRAGQRVDAGHVGLPSHRRGGGRLPLGRARPGDARLPRLRAPG